MKKHIKHTILFAIILVCILCALQEGIDMGYRHRANDKYARVMNHQLDPDIMIFGSSNVLRHFNPVILKEVTGLSSWNMGYDGMFFLEYNALIRESLTYEKKCRYMIIGCNPYFGKDWIVMRPDFFYSFLGERNIYESLKDIEPQKFILAKYLPGYRLTLYNRSFYWSLFYRNLKPDTLMGFEPQPDTAQKFNDFIKPFDEPFDQHLYETMQATIQLATARGIKVILVMPPIYEKGYELIRNIEFIKSKYRSLAVNGVRFLDYTTDSICRNREHFHNYSHLNPDGAKLFSYTFAKDFLKLAHD